jgi:hypothetical protein
MPHSLETTDLHRFPGNRIMRLSTNNTTVTGRNPETVNLFHNLTICFPNIQVQTSHFEFMENLKEANTRRGRVWINTSNPGRTGHSVSSKGKFWCQSGPVSIKRSCLSSRQSPSLNNTTVFRLSRRA